MATAPTAIPAFAPVESDDEDEDGESVGLGWKEPPVGQPMLSLSDREYSVGTPVIENSFSSESSEGARVGYINAEVSSVASISVAAIVGLSVGLSDPVANPVTSTAEVRAPMQIDCQYRTACVASLNEQRLCRQGVISVISSSDFEHWQEMSVASAQLLSARPVSRQYSCEMVC